jgi:hypothetical protein
MNDKLFSELTESIKEAGKISRGEIVPSKAERQAAFVAACKRENLSSLEIVRRASVFQPGVPCRVLKWPKLPA